MIGDSGDDDEEEKDVERGGKGWAGRLVVCGG